MKTSVMRAVMTFAVATGVGCATSSASKGQDGASTESAALSIDVKPVKNVGARKRVGIMDFENAVSSGYRGRQDPVAMAARDAVSEALQKSGAFIVIEREQLAAVLGEQALGQTGAMNAQSAAKVSQALGLQALVTGKVTDYNGSNSVSGYGGFYRKEIHRHHARVSLRIIDATTGELWASESGEGTVEQDSTIVMGAGAVNDDSTLGKRALYKAIGQMINKVVGKAAAKPWTGSVAKISSGRIYVTGGSDVGLPEGTVLSVRKLGEEITDPGTGMVIGRELGRVVGKLQVAEHVNEKLTVCVASSGSGFNAGDVVAIEPAAK